jgi:hypothetical protein
LHFDDNQKNVRQLIALSALFFQAQGFAPPPQVAERWAGQDARIQR